MRARLLRLALDGARAAAPPRAAPRRRAPPAAAAALSSSAAAAAAPERLVLGIESSCDDTGVAVVSSSGRILGEALASQADVHAAFGGVVPALAAEAHAAAMDACLSRALAQAGVAPTDLAAVAVTVGPGLSLCLRVGAHAARRLAAAHALPLIPVHHMEAHALVARLDRPDLEFPFLCLLVSGGHNLLVVAEGVGRYALLGATLDDAVGEAFDKVARLLGLEARPSGGAALEALAARGDPKAVRFTVPLRRRPTCDFSFAGLKTAVRLAVETRLGERAGSAAPWAENLESGGGPELQQFRADVAASFQAVAVAHLAERTARALRWAREAHPELRHVVVAGGVASNSALRTALEAAARAGGAELVAPPPRLCADNGAMVAWAGAERLLLGLGVEPPPPAAAADDEAEWVDVRPRWPLTDRRDARAFSAPRSAKKSRVSAALELLTAGGG
jgi:N6-L-threonylcarbamoyladenine synthase